jgi:hypothetical protein
MKLAPSGWTVGGGAEKLRRSLFSLLAPSYEARRMLIAPLTGRFHPTTRYKLLLEASTRTRLSDLNFKLPFLFHSRFTFKRLTNNLSPSTCFDYTVRSAYVFCCDNNVPARIIVCVSFNNARVLSKLLLLPLLFLFSMDGRHVVCLTTFHPSCAKER